MPHPDPELHKEKIVNLGVSAYPRHRKMVEAIRDYHGVSRSRLVQYLIEKEYAKLVRQGHVDA